MDHVIAVMTTGLHIVTKDSITEEFRRTGHSAIILFLNNHQYVNMYSVVCNI